MDDSSASISSGGVAPWRRQASCSGSSNNSNNSNSPFSANNSSPPPPPPPPSQSTVMPPPPPPMMSSSLPPQRLNTEIGCGRGGHGPPSAIAGAMMKDKKPFTYTPGGIDLSEIRSPRMAKRIAMNAAAEGVTSQNLPQPQNPPPAPLPPAYLAAIQPQIMCPVLPQAGSNPVNRHHPHPHPHHTSPQQPPTPPPVIKAQSRHNHINSNPPPEQNETSSHLHNHFNKNQHNHQPQPRQPPSPLAPPSTVTQLHFTPTTTSHQLEGSPPNSGSSPPADSDDGGKKCARVEVPWRGEAAQLQKAPIPWLNSAHRTLPPSPPYVVSNGVGSGGTQFTELVGGGGPTVRTTINIPISKANHSNHINNGGEQRNVPPGGGGRVIPIQIQREGGLKESRISQPTSSPETPGHHLHQVKTIPIQVFDGSSNNSGSINSTSQKFAQKKPMPSMSKSEAVATLSEGIKRMASLESPCSSPQIDETEPRFKGGSIPSRAFKTLQNTLPQQQQQQQQQPQRQQQTENWVRGEEGGGGGHVVHNIQIRVEPQSPGVSAAHQPQLDQPPQRYMGSNIPSRSFKILQAMTSTDEPPLEHEAGAEQKNKFNSKNSRAQSCPPQSQSQPQSWPNPYHYSYDIDYDQMGENNEYGGGGVPPWDPIYSHWYYMWLYASAAASANYFNNINCNEFQNYSQPQTPFCFTHAPSQYHHDGPSSFYNPTQISGNDSDLYEPQLVNPENGHLDQNGQLEDGGHKYGDEKYLPDYTYYETENETLPTCCYDDSRDSADFYYDDRKFESCDKRNSDDFEIAERMIENGNEKSDEKFESSTECDEKIEKMDNFLHLISSLDTENQKKGEGEGEGEDIDLKSDHSTEPENDSIKSYIPSDEYLPLVVKDKTRFEDDEACSSSSEISNISVIENKIEDLQIDEEDDDEDKFETTATFSLPLKFSSNSTVYKNENFNRPISPDVASCHQENYDNSIPGEYEEEPCVSITISLSRSGTIEPNDEDGGKNIANQEEEIDFWGQIKNSFTQEKEDDLTEEEVGESKCLDYKELSREIEPEEEDSGDYVGNFWDIVDRQEARKIETPFQSRPKKMKSWVISESYEWRGFEDIDQEIDEESYGSEEETDDVEKVLVNSESESEISNNVGCKEEEEDEDVETEEDCEMETEAEDDSEDFVTNNEIEIEILPSDQKEDEGKEVNIIEKVIQDESCHSTEDYSSKSSSETIGSGGQLDSSRKAFLMDKEVVDEESIENLKINLSKNDEKEKLVGVEPVVVARNSDSPCTQCSSIPLEKTALPPPEELMLSKQAENLLWRIERFLQQSLGSGGLPASEGDDSGVLTDEPGSSRPVSDIDVDTEPEADSSSCQPQNTIWGQDGDMEKLEGSARATTPLSLPENKGGVHMRGPGGRGRRYQKAKTHSRLFQLLQDENKDDEDENEEEGEDENENEAVETKIVQQQTGRRKRSVSPCGDGTDGSLCKVESEKSVLEYAPGSCHRDLHLDLETRKSRLLPLPIRRVNKLCSKSSLESTSNSGSSGFLSPISPLKPDQLLADMIEEFQRRFQNEQLTGSIDQNRDFQQGALRSFPSKIFRLLQGEFGEEFYHTFDCQQLSMSPSAGANKEANTSSDNNSTGNFIVIETETAVPTLPQIHTSTHYSYLTPNSAHNQYHYRKHRPSKIVKKKFMTN